MKGRKALCQLFSTSLNTTTSCTEDTWALIKAHKKPFYIRVLLQTEYGIYSVEQQDSLPEYSEEFQAGSFVLKVQEKDYLTRQIEFFIWELYPIHALYKVQEYMRDVYEASPI